MNETRITPTDNGPCLVQGNITLLDADGNTYQASDTIALCRCGHSNTKPFCDGTHEKANFAAINRSSTSTTAPITTDALARAGTSAPDPSRSRPSSPR
jgi:CDGSH-type Zn-finger protein